MWVCCWEMVGWGNDSAGSSARACWGLGTLGVFVGGVDGVISWERGGVVVLAKTEGTSNDSGEC
jgi:hypothetical protein